MQKHRIILSLGLILTLLNPTASLADGYPLPEDGSRLIGVQHEYIVQPGDTLQSITKLYNVGLIALMESNPGVDPFLPAPGTILQIPSQMLLPDVPYQGIVINLPELRLYYFPKDKNEVHVFPIGIGRIGRSTPTMQTSIHSKVKNPTWTPTAQSRAEYFAETGEHYPAVIPAGPDNPLGAYKMRLAYGRGEYLIHGTNKDFGIGMRVSAGCIRLNPDDIEWLFYQVDRNESVRIINEPIKVSTEPNGTKILEVHSPVSRSEDDNEFSLYWTDEIIKFNNQELVDDEEVTKALLLHQGIPVVIDR
ncbi:L,D-transpeptidase family protein [Psychromonas sp.]|uniref:L,D-transpeptidase family protein n=1 Tax=Psychromonas sp. TaxID=1884585 RepID=UPI0035679609